MGNSVTAPLGLIRPILFVEYSVDHRFPSGPPVISSGALPGVGLGNSVMAPNVVMCPILLAYDSANQRFPSGPAVIPNRPESAVGTVNSLNRWAASACGPRKSTLNRTSGMTATAPGRPGRTRPLKASVRMAASSLRRCGPDAPSTESGCFLAHMGAGPPEFAVPTRRDPV